MENISLKPPIEINSGKIEDKLEKEQNELNNMAKEAITNIGDNNEKLKIQTRLDLLFIMDIDKLCYSMWN